MLNFVSKQSLVNTTTHFSSGVVEKDSSPSIQDTDHKVVKLTSRSSNQFLESLPKGFLNTKTQKKLHSVQLPPVPKKETYTFSGLAKGFYSNKPFVNKKIVPYRPTVNNKDIVFLAEVSNTLFYSRSLKASCEMSIGLDDLLNALCIDDHKKYLDYYLKSLLSVFGPKTAFDNQVLQFLKQNRADHFQWVVILPQAIIENLVLFINQSEINLVNLPAMDGFCRYLIELCIQIPRQEPPPGSLAKYEGLSDWTVALLLSTCRRPNLLAQMPAVKDVINRWSAKQPFQGIQFAAVQHLFPTNYENFLAFIEMGVDLNHAIVEGKMGSTNDWVYHQLRADGWQVCEESRKEVRHLAHNAEIEILQRLFARNPYKKKLLLDEGGRFVRALHLDEKLRTYASQCVIVEQTEHGRAELDLMLRDGVDLLCPIWDVARSPLKKNKEGAIIGADVVVNTWEILKNIHPQLLSKLPKVAVILGYGPVGQGVARALKKDYTVWVFDPDPAKMELAKQHGFLISRKESVEERKKETLKNASLLFGCAACTLDRPVITEDDYQYLPQICIAINAASGIYQFPTKFVPNEQAPNEKPIQLKERRYSKFASLNVCLGTKDETFYHRILQLPNGKEILLPRGGAAINRIAGVPAPFIDVTRALILETCAYAATVQVEPGIHSVPLEIQNNIEKIVNNYLKHLNLSFENPDFSLCPQAELLPPSGLPIVWKDYLNIEGKLRAGEVLCRSLDAAMQGMSLLHYSILTRARLSDKQIEKLLKFDLDARDQYGRTPLHYACMVANPYLVQFLIDKGSNPNACDDDGRTPFHYAFIAEAHSVSAVLCKNRAAVNALDQWGLKGADYQKLTPGMFMGQENLEALSIEFLRQKTIIEWYGWILRYLPLSRSFSLDLRYKWQNTLSCRSTNAQALRELLEEIISTQPIDVARAMQNNDYVGAISYLHSYSLAAQGLTSITEQAFKSLSIFEASLKPAPGEVWWHLLQGTEKYFRLYHSSSDVFSDIQPNSILGEIFKNIKKEQFPSPYILKEANDAEKKLEQLLTEAERLEKARQALKNDKLLEASILASTVASIEAAEVLNAISDKALLQGDEEFASVMKKAAERAPLSYSEKLKAIKKDKAQSVQTSTTQKSTGDSWENGLKGIFNRKTTLPAVKLVNNEKTIIALNPLSKAQANLPSPLPENQAVDIRGFAKYKVLQALFNHASIHPLVIKALPGAVTMYSDPKFLMSDEEAQKLIQKSSNLYFDYVHVKDCPRCIKVDLQDDSFFDPRLYDRDHGSGAAAKAISRLRGSYN
ncbi:MAG: binding protein beta chain [Chlamydiales bacterium]|jgi:S-adenosylhomocysteine hydrolase|nr:binding protein beta chain [Chlamydiales bacterium]